MDKKYTIPALEIIELDEEDIVTNSTPWLASGGAAQTNGFDGDTQNLHWTNEES